jgi:uncharacterized protein VirK/YbjX
MTTITSAKPLWRQLARLFVTERSRDGTLRAGVRVGKAMGALWFLREHRELFNLDVYRDYVEGTSDVAPLFHLSHRHYLSTRLTYRQRVECALTHYRYESQCYDARYHAAVYRDDGLLLWSQRADDVHYAIKLRPTGEPHHEGGISIVLLADDQCLNEMSFVWVDGAVLGAASGILPFVTRNQSVRYDSAALKRFRDAFPQNSPSYFCLAAMQGIALAHGRSRLAGIRHEYQIAYTEDNDSSFRRSYTELWKTFGGIELEQVYMIPVPLATPPLLQVKAKHRRRALERRRRWAEVEDSAAEATCLRRVVRGSRLDAAATQLLGSLAAHVPALVSLSLCL